MKKLTAPQVTDGDWNWANDEVFEVDSNASICVVLQNQSGQANARFLAGSKSVAGALDDSQRILELCMDHFTGDALRMIKQRHAENRAALLASGYSEQE